MEVETNENEINRNSEICRDFNNHSGNDVRSNCGLCRRGRSPAKNTMSVVHATTVQRTYAPQGQINATSEGNAYCGQLIEVRSKSAVKRYMDFTTVTDTSSKQYAILQKGEIQSNGLISVNGFVCAALGSSYGQIGDKYIFILQDGSERKAVKIIKADEKQDRHTLNGEGWLDTNGNILEMVVCTNALPAAAKTSGDCNEVKEIRGNVIKIIKENQK